MNVNRYAEIDAETLKNYGLDVFEYEGKPYTHQTYIDMAIMMRTRIYSELSQASTGFDLVDRYADSLNI